MTSPLVTAIIPAYNHERYVQESIRSFISQTYQRVELLVFNDGSSDGTHQKICELIDECQRRFVRFEYINQSNRGLAATLNQALAMSRGEYFTLLASDDIILPDKIEVLLRDLSAREPLYAAAFGDAVFVGDDGRPLTTISESPPASGDASPTPTFFEFYATRRGIDLDSDEFGSYRSLLRNNYLPAMSCLVRTAPAREVGGWTPGNPIEDWELWLKLARQYRFSYIPRPVALYRIHGLNIHRTLAPSLNHATLRLLMREKQFCRDNQLTDAWREQYILRLLNHIRGKEYSLRQKLAAIDIAEGVALTPKLLRRVAREAWRALMRR